MYSSIDTRQETKFDPDFDRFVVVMDALGTISVPKPATNPPIRQRYLLIEALAHGGQLKLETLDQKINYSTVLIRRGRALEAVRFLADVQGENKESRNHFLVLSQLATAHFLTGNPDFEGHSLRYIDRALKNWPKTWTDCSDEQQNLLKTMGWDEFDFDRNRRCEEHFQRLMIHRLNEKKLRDQKKEVEEVLDPIFLDDNGKPIRFVNDKGEYEAARIAEKYKKHLRRDSVEDVELLLTWMPGDNRLLWLLAELFNAKAMDFKEAPLEKHRAVHNANKIFARLLDFKAPVQYAKNVIRSHHKEIAAYAEANPIDVFVPPVEDPVDSTTMTKLEWWRTLGVAGAVGAVIGMLLLWQVQEFRRRRQARGSS